MELIGGFQRLALAEQDSAQFSTQFGIVDFQGETF